MIPSHSGAEVAPAGRGRRVPGRLATIMRNPLRPAPLLECVIPPITMKHGIGATDAGNSANRGHKQVTLFRALTVRPTQAINSLDDLRTGPRTPAS